MRRTGTFTLLILLVLTGIVPVIGQKPADARVARRPVGAGVFETVRAITDGAGVLVRWQMRSEAGVSVYGVYRVSNGERIRLNPTMIGGSASKVGHHAAYGEIYQFFDLDGEVGVEYVVEGIGLDGRKFSSKSTFATAVKSIEAETGISSQVFAEARASTNSNIEQRSATLSGELQDLVSLHEQEPDPENQRWVASQPGAKIMVRKDGFYRVTLAELQSADFPIQSDPANWRLFMNGVEQAIIIGPDTQYVEFYGKALDTPETDIRFYYLIADTVPGKRIASKFLRGAPGTAPAFRYPVVAGKKERSFFEAKMFNGPDENFVGSFFNDQPARITFTLTGIDESVANARIDIQCFGFSSTTHEVLATLNGHDLPAFSDFGRVFYSRQFTVPTTHLQEGVNELVLRSPSGGDQSFFDKLEVHYEREYVADQEKLSFSTPGFRRVDIKGFSSPSVRVFDMTFDGEPVLIANATVAEGEVGYTATIPSSRAMVGYAVEDTGIRQSPGITKNISSTLWAASNQADMLIISHGTPGFMTASEAWAEYRRSTAGGSLNTKVINITDVYDEFSFGSVDVAALKAFIQRAKEEWADPPNYVLLMGDTTYDPRNYEGLGNFNLIPSQSVTYLLEEGASDEALGDFDGDMLSEISIGRIPARTVNQITTAFNKTKLFEQNQANFQRGGVFIFDNPIGWDFESMSYAMSESLPNGTPISYVGAVQPDAQEATIQAINTGAPFVNYSGHGAAGLLSSTNFFNNNTVPSLTNSPHPNVFTMLTCFTGYFLRTNADSLAETLLFAPGGGSAAVWASTSETTPDIQAIMGERFFEQLADTTIIRLGDLTRDAKSVIPAGTDVRASWVLLGDPALLIP